MKRSNDFPFERARRITPREVEAARRAIEMTAGKPRRPRGRPAKPASERYRPVFIRLHPKVLGWAKRAAIRRGVGYQTVINETLLKNALKQKALA
jgi:uncharacterized protein (DUF4415 family)